MNEISTDLSCCLSSSSASTHRNDEDPLEVRLEELAHHIRIEKAVVDGSQRIMKMLQANKSQDKNALKDVSHVFDMSRLTLIY